MSLRRTFEYSTRKIAAIACLGAYLFGGLELLPQLLALGAAVEGSHTVQISCSESKVTVALRHDRQSSVKRSSFKPHRHGAVAWTLCILSESGKTKADHVTSFATSPQAERPTATVKPALNREPASSGEIDVMSSGQPGISTCRVFPAADHHFLSPVNSVLLCSTILLV